MFIELSDGNARMIARLYELFDQGTEPEDAAKILLEEVVNMPYSELIQMYLQVITLLGSMIEKTDINLN